MNRPYRFPALSLGLLGSLCLALAACTPVTTTTGGGGTPVTPFGDADETPIATADGGAKLTYNAKGTAPTATDAKFEARSAAARLTVTARAGADLEKLTGDAKWRETVERHTEITGEPVQRRITTGGESGWKIEAKVEVDKKAMLAFADSVLGAAGLGRGQKELPEIALMPRDAWDEMKDALPGEYNWKEYEKSALEALRTLAKDRGLDPINLDAFYRGRSAIEGEALGDTGFTGRYLIGSDIVIIYDMQKEMKGSEGGVEFVKISCKLEGVDVVTGRTVGSDRGYSENIPVTDIDKGITEACRTAMDKVWDDIMGEWQKEVARGWLYAITVAGVPSMDESNAVYDALSTLCKDGDPSRPELQGQTFRSKIYARNEFKDGFKFARAVTEAFKAKGLEIEGNPTIKRHAVVIQLR